jgi:hypothetical protein
LHHRPAALLASCLKSKNMHQNAVFGALVGGFIHKFPKSVSAGRNVLYSRTEN